MTTLFDQVFNTLKTVKRPGNFYATGKLEVFPPHLEVEGVGRIALPLLATQAEQLVAVAEVAPYGLGSETIVDTKVRKTWQIDESRVSITGKHWQANLNDMVKRVAEGLGVAGEVKAELYKLLVYDAGSFFVSHRDTEKAAGMFATMVVVLPSAYSGGELIISHQQQQVKLDLQCDDTSEIAFAAFYADCLHEVLPITMGCRLTLIYNLMRTDKKMPLPHPPDYRHEENAVAALLRNWAERLKAGEAEPEKLIYLLEHEYTLAELGFDALKGADAAATEALLAASQQADCDIHLALVSVEESGNAEYSGYGRHFDEDDFEEGEVCERTESVSAWRRQDGQPSHLPPLPFIEDEFCPFNAFSDIEPDDVQFQEATGNAGASFERTYHCAAVVIWPKARYLAIINQAGLNATMPVLNDFCQQLESEGVNQNSTLWNEAHTLAGYMLRDWIPGYLGAKNVYSSKADLTAFIEYVYRLRDSELLGRLWMLLRETGIHNTDYCAALAKSVELLPWAEVAAGVNQSIKVSANTALEACAELLSRISAKNPTKNQGVAHDLHFAAETLFNSLPGDPQRFKHLDSWTLNRLTTSSNLVVHTLGSFSFIDRALAEQALDYFLNWPESYAMDAVLVPAALQLTETTTHCDRDIAERLRQAVRAHLQARTAQILEAPADNRRESLVTCKCADCAQLRIFLDNPSQANWSFRAAQNRRSHIEQSIRSNKCDVDYVTERKGSPHILVCTKNQASYLRRVAQRKQDIEILTRLTRAVFR